MNLQEDIKPVTYLKNHTAEVLHHINETRRHMVITQNGEAKAVLQDAASFEKLRSAILMMKLMLQGNDDIEKGRVFTTDEVFAEVRNKLNKKFKKNG